MPAVATSVLLCTDGSELARDALVSGVTLLRPAERTIIVTVIETPDETLVTGSSGAAGGVMTPEQFEEVQDTRRANGERMLADVAADLGIDGVETRVLYGDARDALCTFAAEIKASAIIMGSRGRGGLRRAFIGSVSDFVARNAPCPVLIVRVGAESPQGH